MPQPRPPSVAQVFDEVAATYDQTGVELFRPVGRRLVDLLSPLTGERALDVGCGRGAVTLPLVEAVGPEGSVSAVDVSPVMAAATRALMAEHAHRVAVHVGDAAGPGTFLAPGASFDVVAASLVLFFVPEPVTALRAWVELLAPGTGRIGITTFGDRDEPTLALDALVMAYAPPGLRDARTTGVTGPFADDAGVAALFAAAGATVRVNRTEPVQVCFDDVAAWERFSRSTGQLAAWKRMPREDRPRVLEEAAAVLDAVRTEHGSHLVWQVRYTVGAAA